MHVLGISKLYVLVEKLLWVRDRCTYTQCNTIGAISLHWV